MLQEHKDLINEQFLSKNWDRYKKYANEYELIFTSGYNFPSISSYVPVSRSYFKMWEILHDHEDIFNFKSIPKMRAAFLAEGPGGFVEAFSVYRGVSFPADQVFGITLLSADKNIPCWKIPQSIMKHDNIQLLAGRDGTGSLYHRNNVDSFVDTIGSATCDLVTADGGFDFSNNFNSQEELSSTLIAAEISTALRLLKAGGVFVLKMFDIHTHTSFQLVSFLRNAFDIVIMTKPLSSRPANSEKYIVCVGFKPQSQETLDALANLKDLKPISSRLVQDIICFNTYNILRQMIHINRTLCLIHTCRHNENDKLFCTHIKTQIENALRWCFRYHVKIATHAIKYYKTTYV